MAETLPDSPQPSDIAVRAGRRRRNIALALVLAAAVVLFYLLTIVKMGPNIFDRVL